ncbi:hypothetical protein ABZP36_009349 [Zizania latifolia]
MQENSISDLLVAAEEAVEAGDSILASVVFSRLDVLLVWEFYLKFLLQVSTSYMSFSGNCELVDNNLSSFDAHPEDLLNRNSPVYFTKVAHVGTKVQGGLVYDLREAGPAECELAKITSRDMILGGDIPDEEKFDVLIWKSRIPPYHGYIATFEKREPGCIVGRGGHLARRRDKRKS